LPKDALALPRAIKSPAGQPLTILSEKDRDRLSKLLQDDEPFLEFVLNETTNGVWLGEANKAFMMKVILSETVEDYHTTLANIGFIVYTDYLYEMRELFLESEPTHLH
jgi:hypothetical protein